MTDRVHMKDLMQELGVKSRSTIWRMLKRGQLPQPVRISTKTLYWLRSDLEAHERTLLEKSRDERAARSA